MATAQQFIEECRKHLGEGSLYTGENPSWAWCAKFLSSVAKDLGMTQFDSWSAVGVYNACTPIADEDVQPGDFVCFNFDGREDTSWFDHIGVVTYADIANEGMYKTIEGNSGANYTVGEYTYYNDTYPPKTYFCRPDYDSEEDMLTDEDIEKIADKVIFRMKIKDGKVVNGDAYATVGNLLWHIYVKVCEIAKKV